MPLRSSTEVTDIFWISFSLVKSVGINIFVNENNTFVAVNELRIPLKSTQRNWRNCFASVLHNIPVLGGMKLKEPTPLSNGTLPERWENVEYFRNYVKGGQVGFAVALASGGELVLGNTITPTTCDESSNKQRQRNILLHINYLLIKWGKLRYFIQICIVDMNLQSMFFFTILRSTRKRLAWEFLFRILNRQESI